MPNNDSPSSLRYPPVTGGGGGGSVSGSHTKFYPTTSRRCSEAIEAYARTGDLEAAAALLTDLQDRTCDDPEGSQAPPPEKERRRMAVVVSCVALIISILAVALVGITFGLSHMMDADLSGEFRTLLY